MPKIVNPLTIVKNGSPTPPTPQPLDPEQVYRDTRPADWLVMPEPQAEEIYFLLSVSEDTVDNVYVNIPISKSGTGNVYLEFGTSDSNGTFTPDSTLTVSLSGGGDLTQTVPISALATAATSKQKQILAKISSDPGVGLNRVMDSIGGTYNATRQLVVEIAGDLPSLTRATWGSNGTGSQLIRLRYVALYSANFGNNGPTFQGDYALIAVLALDTSGRKSFESMFNNCSSLTAIPQLNTSSGTNFTYMFSGCYSLITIPQLDTSSGTNFGSMFSGCCSLITIPLLDTSHGTDFSTMFTACSSLTAIPQLNTSSGTNFNNMFNNCYSLTAIPQLNTSSGTNFTYMFSTCRSLITIPQLDTSSGTDFSSMFSGCCSLITVPQLNTSSGTNFSNMFSTCRSLITIPQLDTSSGTDFSSMFSGCYSLITVPQLNTSSGTNFSNMFSGCYSLTGADFTGYDFSLTSANTNLNMVAGDPSPTTIDFGSKWPANTYLTRQLVSGTTMATAAHPVKVRINKTDSMLAIGANATTLFGGSASVLVYVPDALLATYQADTYWATLGTRLKAMSEWSA